MTRFATPLALLALAAALAAPSRAQETGAAAYQSPYSVRFSYPASDLIGDIESGGRGDFKQHSSLAYAAWYSEATRRRWGAWGVPFKNFEPPAGIEGKGPQWKRERVLAVALRYVGYSYQHHHLPDWEPPAGWPWLKVAAGHNGKGVDCSNFTAFVYSLALGLRMSSAIGAQASQATLHVQSRSVAVQSIARPASFDACVRELKTGDLLYIRALSGQVSHVVLWAGSIVRSPDGTPLVLDSTGSGHLDCEGHSIPDGVQLRPFTRSSWYFNSLSHIHRAIPDD